MITPEHKAAMMAGGPGAPYKKYTRAQLERMYNEGGDAAREALRYEFSSLIVSRMMKMEMGRLRMIVKAMSLRMWQCGFDFDEKNVDVMFNRLMELGGKYDIPPLPTEPEKPKPVVIIREEK